MSIYADTSFFVSLYLPDAHSYEASRRIAKRPTVWLTPLHCAEWAHAISQNVFQGKISVRELEQVHELFEKDRKAGLWREVDFPHNTFEKCVSLAHRYVTSAGTRTLDSLHVASALELQATRFWTFDLRQAKLAKAVGFKTEEPIF